MKPKSPASFSAPIWIALRLKNLQAQNKNFCRVLDIRVAEIVESDAGQPRTFQNPLEHVQHAVRGHGASGGRWEYPFAVTRFSSLLHQNVYRVCRQRQCAVGVFCFQRHLNDLAVDAPDLALNPKVSFFQINVRPF